MREFFNGFLQVLPIIISWPVATIVIVVLFRRQIAVVLSSIMALLGNITTVKIGPVAVELSDRIKMTYRESKDLYSNFDLKDKKNSEEIFGPDVYHKEMIRIAKKVAPIAVIPFAYTNIERAIELVDDSPVYFMRRDVINEMVKEFLKQDKITEKDYKLFRKMQKIHDDILSNKITAIEKTDAIRYGKAAGYLITIIRYCWTP